MSLEVIRLLLVTPLKHIGLKIRSSCYEDYELQAQERNDLLVSSQLWPQLLLFAKGLHADIFYRIGEENLITDIRLTNI